MITENLSTLKIHKLTKAQYERELAAGRIDSSALYLTPDDASASNNFYVQDTEPTDAADGAIWVDTSDDALVNLPDLPSVTSADNGKVLMVVNGKWQLVDPSLSVDENGVVSA